MEIVKVEALGGRSITGREGGAALEGRSNTGREGGGALEGRKEEHWKGGRSSTGREGGTVPEVGFVCLEGKVEFRGWKKMYESKRKNSKMYSKPEAAKDLF